MLDRQSVANGGIYVKFFANPESGERIDPETTKLEEFSVIITDLITTGMFNIRKSQKNSKGIWKLTDLDGEIIELPQEPKAEREIKYVRFFLKSKVWWDEPKYGTYDEAKKTLDKHWHLEHITEDNRKIQTGYLVKLWKKKDRVHAITCSGSHYTFLDS